MLAVGFFITTIKKKVSDKQPCKLSDNCIKEKEKETFPSLTYLYNCVTSINNSVIEDDDKKQELLTLTQEITRYLWKHVSI